MVSCYFRIQLIYIEIELAAHRFSRAIYLAK